MPETPAFLAGGGTCGALMRSHCWSHSPLGDPSGWSAPLRTIVSLMLSSRFPMFIAWGQQLAFLYNDAYAEILGGKHPQALGQPFEDIWAEIWQEVGPIAQRALQGEASYYENLPLTMSRRGFDEQTWFTFSYSPALDEVGKVAGVFCVCSETTAQVLAERERQGELERLRTLFEQAPGFMAVLRGPEHVFDLTNHAYLQLIGHRDVLGKPLLEVLPEVENQGFVSLLDKVYRSGQPYIGRMESIMLQRDPDGTPRRHLLDFVYQPIRDASGSVYGIFVEGHDVTERARAIEGLKASDRRKDEFLAMLAHELRNPLSPISNAAHLLRNAKLDGETVRRAGEVISRQVGHMTKLVDDLLDVSRVTRGLITLECLPLDMHIIVDTAVEQVRQPLASKAQRIAVISAGEAALVRGDRTRMVQVVANLLANAVKFTPPHGRIEVAVETEQDEVVISVRDNGIGLDASLLPHIFELFTQADRTPDRAQGGLGLGLALVRSLVELQGGHVLARSDGIGLGSEFTLSLPRHVESVPSPQVTQDVDLTEACSVARHILVVDDNIDAATTLAMLLAARGHKVGVEHDAAHALDYVRRDPPQVMVLDIGLPGIDGYELARRLRANPSTAAATMIALTGYGQPRDRMKSKAAGFDHFMVKPADPTRLQAILDRPKED